MARDEEGKTLSFEEERQRRENALPFIMFDRMAVSLDALDFIEGLLCEGQMSCIYGASNCGKTFFMTDLSLHVAMGRDWRGLHVEQGGVIYCALEGSHGIVNRVMAFAKEHQIEGEDIPFAVVPTSINLLNPAADVGKLIDLILAVAKKMGCRVVMVVIDTLSRALAGGNENAPDDMGALVTNADRVRKETGVHLAFVHHSGKDEARGMRGHSILLAAIDTEIEIVRPEEGGGATATVTKQREMEKVGVFPFTLRPVILGENRHGKAIASCVVDHGSVTTTVTKKRASPSGKEKRALEVLSTVFADYGFAVPSDQHLPGGTVVKIELFRAALRSSCVTSEENERRDWSRIKDGLDNKGYIRMFGELLWRPVP